MDAGVRDSGSLPVGIRNKSGLRSDRLPEKSHPCRGCRIIVAEQKRKGAPRGHLHPFFDSAEMRIDMNAKGTVFKYGDNVDTDVIIPARYLNSSDPAELATHCMEDIDAEFIKKVQKGDIIVAEKNFGCGSSREHAPIAIKTAGVSCVIAETFARIFYRNAINIGLPIIECPEASKGIQAGDEVEVNFDTGMITNVTRGTTFKGQAFPEFMQKIIASEGLINYINSK